MNATALHGSWTAVQSRDPQPDAHEILANSLDVRPGAKPCGLAQEGLLTLYDVIIIFDIMSKMETTSPLRVTPQARKKIGKSERTRAEILNSVLDFTWSRPFSEMTVSSLMDLTDFSRSTFYAHFNDLHEPMEAVLDLLKDEILAAVQPWLMGVGDPVARLSETLEALMQVGYRRGPFLKAIADAAGYDARFEKVWERFLGEFDTAGSARIRADQEQGLIEAFDPGPVVFALNRMNARTMVAAFGKRPRERSESLSTALARIWISTLYGTRWAEMGSSELIRK
ncbi:MAG: TetR/AcrR family transcriptional regulator [Parasphingorhabdus sp.]|uniref:TetR/AcrR family transcriptional regulator n=1 Tax=Parasphingorhabdus sp. TaxID=2709688 RepID=UPI0032995D7A